MSVETLAVVLHHSRAAGTTKLVLIGIANHAGDGGAWPTVATLAKYANATERTVQRCIAELVKSGELRVDRQRGGVAYMVDSKRPNRYDVMLRCPQNCDRTTQHRLVNPQALSPTLPRMPGLPRSVRVTPTSPGDTGVTPPGDTGVTLTIHRTQPPKPSAVEPESVTRELTEEQKAARSADAARLREQLRAARDG